MKFQNIYHILSTAVFLYLGIIWTKSDIRNVNIKLILVVLAIAGMLIILSDFGYIIKV